MAFSCLISLAPPPSALWMYTQTLFLLLLRKSKWGVRDRGTQGVMRIILLLIWPPPPSLTYFHGWGAAYEMLMWIPPSLFSLVPSSLFLSQAFLLPLFPMAIDQFSSGEIITWHHYHLQHFYLLGLVSTSSLD